MSRKHVAIVTLTAILVVTGCQSTEQDPARSQVKTVPNTTDVLCLPEMIGLGTLVLKDSSKAQEFEKFIVEAYYPLTAEHFPGMQWIVLKRDRGNKGEEYILLGVFESSEKRDYYYPVEGEGLSEENKKLWREAGGDTLTEKLLSYANATWLGDYQPVR